MLHFAPRSRRLADAGMRAKGVTVARLQPLKSKDEVPADGHAAFDSIVASRGSMPGPFAVMMHAPEVAGRTAHLGAYLRFESSLPPEVQELAIITATREFDCAPEWSGHAQRALRVGVSGEAIDVVGSFGDPGGLPEGERLVVRFTRELLQQHRVSQEAFEAVRARFGERGVVELAATAGYYGLVASVVNVAELEPAPGGVPLPPRAKRPASS